jgi:hypothetical protein
MCSGGGAHMGMLPCSMRRHILPYSEKWILHRKVR